MRTIIDSELKKIGIFFYEYYSSIGENLFGFSINNEGEGRFVESQGYPDKETAYKFLLMVLELPLREIPLGIMAYLEDKSRMEPDDRMYETVHEIMQKVVKNIESAIVGGSVKVTFLPDANSMICIEWTDGKEKVSQIVHPHIIYYEEDPVKKITDVFLLELSFWGVKVS